MPESEQEFWGEEAWDSPEAGPSSASYGRIALRMPKEFVIRLVPVESLDQHAESYAYATASLTICGVFLTLLLTVGGIVALFGAAVSIGATYHFAQKAIRRYREITQSGREISLPFDVEDTITSYLQEDPNRIRDGDR